MLEYYAALWLSRELHTSFGASLATREDERKRVRRCGLALLLAQRLLLFSLPFRPSITTGGPAARGQAGLDRPIVLDPFSSASHPGELHSRMRTTHPLRTDSGC
jgi:hypothetical protein